MGQDARSVEYISGYCRRRLGGALWCDVSPDKGRILRAGRHFEKGASLFVEPPLLLVAEAPQDPSFDRLRRLVGTGGLAHAPLWYWSALCSLTAEDLKGCEVPIPAASPEQQTQLLLLCHSETTEMSPDMVAITKEFWPSQGSGCAELVAKLERLLAVWLLNCFEHSEDPIGFSTFFLPSFISHSCSPNCMWHYSGDNFVLRAREEIAPREEVTVSYLSEEALLGSTVSRRRQLDVTKQFVCYCDRCEAPVDRTRGFACPGCQTGTRALLIQRIDQVSELCGQEARVEELMQEWDRKSVNAAPDVYLTDAVALRLETNLVGLFSPHHWLRDRAGRHLVAYYEATGRADLALPLARQSAEFTREIYPGCSALHAWALETQGDLMLRLQKFSFQGLSAVEPPLGATAEALSHAFREVEPIYDEADEVPLESPSQVADHRFDAQATRILGALFGDDHEFYTVMREKYASFVRATRGVV